MYVHFLFKYLNEIFHILIQNILTTKVLKVFVINTITSVNLIKKNPNFNIFGLCIFVIIIFLKFLLAQKKNEYIQRVKNKRAKQAIRVINVG